MQTYFLPILLQFWIEIHLEVRYIFDLLLIFRNDGNIINNDIDNNKSVHVFQSF